MGDAAAQSPPAPFALTSRVGDTIDQSEQAYFSLFRTIYEFKQARVSASLPDSVRFSIEHTTTHGNPERVDLTVSRAAAEELNRCIDNYEHVQNLTPPINFALLRGLVSFRKRYRSGSIVSVKTADGQSVTGQLLRVSDSLMAISQNPIGYDWQSANRDVVVQSMSEVTSGLVMRSSWRRLRDANLYTAGLGLFGLIGYVQSENHLSFNSSLLLTGASVVAGLLHGRRREDTYYVYGDPDLLHKTAHSLKQYQAFMYEEAPEIRQVDLPLSKHQMSHRDLDELRASLPFRRFHVSFGNAYQLYDPARLHTRVAALVRVEESDRKGGHAPMWYIDMAYALRRSMTVGGELQYSPAGAGSNELPLSGYSARAYVDYSLLAPDPLLFHRWAVAIGAGGAYFSARTETRFNYAPNLVTFLLNHDVDPASTYVKKTDTAFAGLIHGVVDYYTTPSTSFRLKWTYQFALASDVPELTKNVEEIRGWVYKIDAHPMTFSGLSLSFGMAFHV